MAKPRSVLTVSPKQAAFEQYTGDLFDAARKLERESQDLGLEILEPIYFSPLDSDALADELAQAVSRHKPALVHIHHEFGFLGSKVPGRYRFPRLIRKLRGLTPETRLTATAHTVLSNNYRYPWQGRGWQTPLRLAANGILLPFVRRSWIQGTWGILDGVIVHSSLQLQTIRSSGCPIASEIPLYVPSIPAAAAGSVPSRLHASPPGVPMLLVFGYFTPEKAQDVAIRAMSELKVPAHLVLAGGVRRPADQGYFERCKALIARLGLTDRVQITGFVDFAELDALAQAATLMLIPFRETSGSASLANLIGRRAAILASDLPLNREIERRAPGSLRFFSNEDPVDCARQIEALLEQPQALAELRKGARKYAELHSPEKIMRKHLEFYRQVLER